MKRTILSLLLASTLTLGATAPSKAEAGLLIGTIIVTVIILYPSEL